MFAAIIGKIGKSRGNNNDSSDGHVLAQEEIVSTKKRTELAKEEITDFESEDIYDTLFDPNPRTFEELTQYANGAAGS